jgi:hypothetical protein
MNTMNKWAITFLGISAFGGALLTDRPAKADNGCNVTTSVSPTSPNAWSQLAASYCSGGGNFTDVNFHAIYLTFWGFAETQATSYTSSNSAPYQLAAEVGCSNGGYYYSSPDPQTFYANGGLVSVGCPLGSYPTASWGFADIVNP